MVNFYLMFEFGVAAFAAIIAAISGSLYYKIKRDRQGVLTKFKLKARDTYHDFIILGVAELFLFGASIIYVVQEGSGLLTLKTSRVLILGTLGLITLGLFGMERRAR